MIHASVATPSVGARRSWRAHQGCALERVLPIEVAADRPLVEEWLLCGAAPLLAVGCHLVEPSFGAGLNRRLG
jgi:hypothetical protein